MRQAIENAVYFFSENYGKLAVLGGGFGIFAILKAALEAFQA